MNYRQNDKVFSPRNLIGHLIIRWKVILVVSLITAFIGGVIGYTRSKNSNEETAAPQYVSDIERTASALTEEQKSEGDEYYSRILEYDQRIKEQQYFNDNCYTMSLDPDKAVGYYMRYLLETDIGNAANYYNGYIISEDDYKAVSELLDPEFGKFGLNEAFWISTNTVEPSYNLDLERTTRLSGDVESKYSLIVTVYVYSPNKETCDGIAKIADDAIAKKTKSLRAQGSDTVCTFIDDGYDDAAKLNVITRKKEKVNLVAALVNGKPGYVSNMLSTVDPKVKSYVNALQGIATELPQDNSEDKGETPHISRFEYVLIGFLSGLILYICIYALLYTLDGRLHTTEDISRYLKTPVLKTISTDALEDRPLKTDIITAFGKKIIGDSGDALESLRIVKEELENIMNNDNIRHVYIAVDGSSESAARLATKISDEAFMDTEFTIGKMMPSAEEMKQLLASEGSVVLPVMDKTKLKTITDFLGTCKRNNKRVIGSVPVWDQKGKHER